MKFSCRLSWNSSRLYHFFVCLLGVRIKLFDFRYIENDGKISIPFRQCLFKWISAIVFLLFFSVYPFCISDILSYSPVFGNQKRIEHFVAIVNTYIKFIAFGCILIFEFVLEHQITTHQNIVKRDLMQLKHVYSSWFAHLNRRSFKSKNWNESLTKLTDLNCGRGIFVIFTMAAYNVFISISISENLHIETSKLYQMLFAFSPNFCVTVFIWHLSELSVQYKKMFQLLDEIIEVIANDIYKQLSMRTKKHNRFKYCVTAAMTEHKLNTAINQLATVMECHNNLKINVLKMRNLYSVQSSTVILSDFIGTIIEVEIGCHGNWSTI